MASASVVAALSLRSSVTCQHFCSSTRRAREHREPSGPKLRPSSRILFPGRNCGFSVGLVHVQGRGKQRSVRNVPGLGLEIYACASPAGPTSDQDGKKIESARDTYGASSSGRKRRGEDFDDVSDDSIAAQARELLSEAEGEQSFFTRLALAWNILFPAKRNKPSSNADIAKQRLKMILISDRCSVNDEAKRRIVNNIVGALSDFVEIESEDKVQLTVSSDPSMGTVYSVTVPVRRVKPEFQDYSREIQNVALTQDFRTLDIKLEYNDALDAQQQQ